MSGGRVAGIELLVAQPLPFTIPEDRSPFPLMSSSMGPIHSSASNCAWPLLTVPLI